MGEKKKKFNANIVQHLLKGSILLFKEAIIGMNSETQKSTLSDHKILSIHYLFATG